MRHDFYIPDDALTRLADESDIEPERRVAFLKAMSGAAITHFLAKNVTFVTKGDMKKKTETLAKKAQLLVNALDNFGEALSGFPRELRHPATKLKDEDVRLYRHQRTPAEVQACREIVKADTEVWGDCASRAYDAIGKINPGGGDNAFNRLLDDLIIVYAAGGKKISIPTFNHKEGKYGGSTYLFIERCFDLLNVEIKPNKTMGKSIERACNRWKKT